MRLNLNPQSATILRKAVLSAIRVKGVGFSNSIQKSDFLEKFVDFYSY